MRIYIYIYCYSKCYYDDMIRILHHTTLYYKARPPAARPPGRSAPPSGPRIYIYIYIYICIYIYTCMQTKTIYIYIYIYMYVCMYVRTYERTYVPEEPGAAARQGTLRLAVQIGPCYCDCYYYNCSYYCYYHRVSFIYMCYY